MAKDGPTRLYVNTILDARTCWSDYRYEPDGHGNDLVLIQEVEVTDRQCLGSGRIT